MDLFISIPSIGKAMGRVLLVELPISGSIHNLGYNLGYNMNIKTACEVTYPSSINRQMIDWGCIDQLYLLSIHCLHFMLITDTFCHMQEHIIWIHPIPRNYKLLILHDKFCPHTQSMIWHMNCDYIYLSRRLILKGRRSIMKHPKIQAILLMPRPVSGEFRFPAIIAKCHRPSVKAFFKRLFLAGKFKMQVFCVAI